MRRVLCATFFLSGAAALLFENLWFRQAHLAFGNGVWAQSLVLASFMAGLAVGGGLATRSDRLVRPIVAYARLEVTVAVTGVLIVFALPRLGAALAPVLGLLYERPILLNATRLALAFVLLAIPTTAMGLTLPLLTRALARGGHDFGENLGALYGWNTLGAVAGAVAVETVLVPRLGVRGTGFAAGSLNVTAAALALLVSRQAEAPTPGPSVATSDPPLATGRGPDGETRRLFAVAFTTGAALLALEVVWFRFLAMFSEGTALSFALLLAAVLLGIAAGGLLAGAWLARRDAVPFLGPLLATSGILVVAQYAGFSRLLPLLGDPKHAGPLRALMGAAYLTFPVSFLSGMVFTVLGAAVRRGLDSDAEAAGALMVANTTGALFGALLGGFVLLPVLGMERSFALLALLYGLAILLLPPSARLPQSQPGRRLAWAAFAVLAAFVALFPHGLMIGVYARAPLARFGPGTILAVREGLTETAVVVEHQYRGEPLGIRLVTNGYSMSSTTWEARRYMGLYVHLPLALHPQARSALLVCYGVGVTARALVRSPELLSIDIVDISPEVLDLAGVVGERTGENPLRDPRVRVHVDDGRAFLSLTQRRFDLITSEPPPPTNADIVNLYSAEYFSLLRSRLAEGGLVSYWLPVHTLDDGAARGVIRAFCGAFPDCTLWSGHDLDWMLVGTRDAREPVTAEHLRQRWETSAGADLRDVGIETPEQMGALFLADASGLARLVDGAEPVTDNWPGRLGRSATSIPTAFSYAVLFGERPREVFAASPFVARLWPASLVPATLGSFRQQEIQNLLFVGRLARREAEEGWLHELYTESSARLPVMAWFGSTPDLQRIARARAEQGDADPWVLHQLAIAALADRRPGEAAARARGALAGGDPQTLFLLAYALALDGRPQEARPLLPQLSPRARVFLSATFPTLADPGAG